MDNPFRDIETELTSHYSDTRCRYYARSFDEFVSKIVHAINTFLAETDAGHELLKAGLDRASIMNMTPEEWKKEYISILETMFFLILDWCKPLKDEFARHTYDMLRKEV